MSETKPDSLIELVIDIETSIKCPIKNNRPSPYWPENKIVRFGMKNLTADVFHILHKTLIPSCKGTLLIGQNIKFDLAYICRESPFFREQLMSIGQIWDIQYAQYLLSGHRHKMMSLDDMCTLYGLELKDDKIKGYWESGIDTEDIPVDELDTYLEHDLNVTGEIYKIQKKLMPPKMQDLMYLQMNALLATLDMELHGITLDTRGISEELKYLVDTANINYKLIQDYLGEDIDIDSRKDLSIALFGGTKVIKTLTPKRDPLGREVVYKTGKKAGQIRYEVTQNEIKHHGMIHKEHAIPTKNPNIYKTDDETLTGYIKNLAALTTKDRDILTKLLEYRRQKININTYYIGYPQFIYPDGKIHTSYLHTVTGTGRLSSRGPNIQNINSKDE